MALFIYNPLPLRPLLSPSFNHDGAPEHGRNKPSQWLNGPGYILANHIARGRQGRPKRVALPVGPGDWSKGSFVERYSARHLPSLYDNAEICIVPG